MESYSIEEINEILSGELVGNTDQQITSPEQLEKAEIYNISFVTSNKYVSFWETSKACAAIVDAKLDIEPEKNRAFIKVKNTDNAITKLLKIPNPGTYISGLINTVTLKVIDDVDNSTSVSFNVEVLDNTAPIITSNIGNQSQLANINCEATLNNYLEEFTAVDNCDDNLTISQSPVAGTIISGNTNTVTLMAVDAAGNSTSKSFNVEVLDTLSPILLCEEDTTIKLKSEQNSYTVKETEFDPIQIEDNCNIKSIANSYNNLETLEGAEFPIGTTTVNWIVTDESDNNTESSQDITVELIDDLCIYPNPTNGIFYISSGLNNMQKIIIYDINGKPIIKRTTINPIELIDLQKHSSGVYIVKLFTRTGIFNRKIIKKLGRD